MTTAVSLLIVVSKSLVLLATDPPLLVTEVVLFLVEGESLVLLATDSPLLLGAAMILLLSGAVGIVEQCASLEGRLGKWIFGE
ncbi:hypothetical protein PRIC2_014966 [Phytophthora ramorum]